LQKQADKETKTGETYVKYGLK